MPRLFENKIDDEILPDFLFLRYSYLNPKDEEQKLDGGFINFGVSLQIPNEAFDF
ncbi:MULTISPECIES: hypothetical protein [unclassified Chryseobacterium]|uniref:hypothetical protein n=1 Tax=unclassified Chryseobacterium TaxID=2593645 RepID=UPI00301B1AA2